MLGKTLKQRSYRLMSDHEQLRKVKDLFFIKETNRSITIRHQSKYEKWICNIIATISTSAYLITHIRISTTNFIYTEIRFFNVIEQTPYQEKEFLRSFLVKSVVEFKCQKTFSAHQEIPLEITVTISIIPQQGILLWHV